MIRTTSTTDVIQPDLETFIFAIFSGIVAADKLSCDYKLELTRNDVKVIADLYKEIKYIEIN